MRTSSKALVRPIVFCLAVTLCCAAWAAPPDEPSKIVPSLEKRLAEDDRPQRVWVFLADKGLATPQARKSAIDAVAMSYDSRATERRRLRGTLAGPDGSVFDLADVPVHPSYVQAVEQTGARVRIESRWLNAVSAVATREQVAAIAALPFVTKVQLVARARRPEPVAQREAAPPPSNRAPQTIDYGRSTDQLTQINVIALHDAGYTGQGVIMGILDTGFRRDHDALNQPGHEVNVIAEYDFVDDDPDASNEPGDPSSQHNHGTLILGTIGSYYPGELVGGAFDASFILAKTEDTTGEYEGEEDNYVAGLEFIEFNGGDMATSSLGYIDWYTQADLDGETAVTTIAVNGASSRGVHLLTAAGNEYHDSDPSTSSLIAPADAYQVITLGAVTSSGSISSFSSEGPTADGRVKPEVLARGSSTQTISSSSTTGFTSADGTSLSTPLAAAAVACIISARPGWSVDTLREQLFLNADEDFGGLGFDPEYVRGYGVLNAMATHANALGISVGPGTGLVSEGPLGGPFDPAGVTYTLGNNNDTPLDYMVSADQSWVDITNPAGTIAANSSIDVTISLNAQAAGLALGSYTTTVDFINTTDHEGDTSREIVLHVARTIIDVSPGVAVQAGGPLGGPFGGSRSYTVTSERPTPVSVQVSPDQPWIALNGAAGSKAFTLDGVGASAEVTVGVSGLAAILPGGVHAGTVSFTNLTSGEGDTTRGVTLEVGGPQPVYSVLLDEDPGWSTTGAWAFGQPSGGGSHSGDPTSGYSGPDVYGYELTGDYPNGMDEEYLTSTPFDCSAMDSVAVRFWRWLGVETSTWDHALVQASNDQLDWTTVWSNDDAGGSIDDDAWSQVTYDLSAVADGQSAVWLRWVMGTTDGSVTYPGWNIDDVELLGIVPGERITVLMDSADLMWTPLPEVHFFDVVRGDLAGLRSSGGDFSVATDGCLANNGTAALLPHGADPAPGTGFWVLVRGIVFGEPPMSYDSSGEGQVAPRDAGIAASGLACP